MASYFYLVGGRKLKNRFSGKNKAPKAKPAKSAGDRDESPSSGLVGDEKV